MFRKVPGVAKKDGFVSFWLTKDQINKLNKMVPKGSDRSEYIRSKLGLK